MEREIVSGVSRLFRLCSAVIRMRIRTERNFIIARFKHVASGLGVLALVVVRRHIFRRERQRHFFGFACRYFHFIECDKIYRGLLYAALGVRRRVIYLYNVFTVNVSGVLYAYRDSNAVRICRVIGYLLLERRVRQTVTERVNYRFIVIETAVIACFRFHIRRFIVLIAYIYALFILHHISFRRRRTLCDIAVLYAGVFKLSLIGESRIFREICGIGINEFARRIDCAAEYVTESTVTFRTGRTYPDHSIHTIVIGKSAEFHCMRGVYDNYYVIVIALCILHHVLFFFRKLQLMLTVLVVGYFSRNVGVIRYCGFGRGRLCRRIQIGGKIPAFTAASAYENHCGVILNGRKSGICARRDLADKESRTFIVVHRYRTFLILGVITVEEIVNIFSDGKSLARKRIIRFDDSTCAARVTRTTAAEYRIHTCSAVHCYRVRPGVKRKRIVVLKKNKTVIAYLFHNFVRILRCFLERLSRYRIIFSIPVFRTFKRYGFALASLPVKKRGKYT